MKKLLNSWAYRKAKGAVNALLQSPKKLMEVIEKAAQKTEKSEGSMGLVGQSVESLKVLIRMMSAYARGDYRAISTENLVLIMASIVYFVMPLDTLPDFIAFLGLTDDAALLVWTLNRVKSEVEGFLEWELRQEKDLTQAENSDDDPKKLS